MANIYSFPECIQKKNDLTDDMIKCNIPFSSSRKKASIAVINKSTRNVRIYSKGAPDMLMKTTDNIITADG